MMRIPQSLMLAAGQLFDPAILRVLAKSLAITVVIFIGLAAGLNQLLPRLLGDYLDLDGDVYVVLSTLIVVIAAWLLFRIIAIAVLQFFADDVVRAVERRHYPQSLETARDLPLREDLANSLRGIGRALLVNAIALPIAAVLLFTAIGPAIVLLLANAILLGRELTDMAWLRHRAAGEAKSPVGTPSRFLLGLIVAGIMLIPFANLLAPVIGAAAGTHMFHLSRKKEANV